MTDLSEEVRREAVRCFEVFLAAVPKDDVLDFVNGKVSLLFASVNSELALLQQLPMEDAHAYLKKLNAAGLKALIAAPVVRVPVAPKLTTNLDRINYVLMQIFGRTYESPSPAQSNSKPASSSTNVDETVSKLLVAKSSREVEGLLVGIPKTKLKAIAKAVGAKNYSSLDQPQLISLIIRFTGGNRRDHQALDR